MSSKPIDCFKLLNVDWDADEKIINSQYKKLSHKYHPDTGGSNELFINLTNAKEILLDKERRKEHFKLVSNDLLKPNYTKNGWQYIITDPNITGIGTISNPLIEGTYQVKTFGRRKIIYPI